MATSAGRVPALDGLRGLAILGVITIHAPLRLFGGGYVGVAVFFALSGYLITTLLLEEQTTTGRINLRQFFVHRVARLLPGLLAALSATLVVIGLLLGPAAIANCLKPATVSVFYVANFLAAGGHMSGGVGDWFSWSWTLSVEEQFYLVWPPVLVLLLARGWRRTAAGVAAVAFTLSAAACLQLDAAQVYNARSYFSSETHLCDVLVGVLLAFALHRRTLPRTAQLLGPVGLAGVLLMFTLPTNRISATAGLVTAVLTVGVIFSVLADPGSLVARGLSWRPLRWLGTVSYSFYLWNILFRMVLLHVWQPSWALNVAWVALSLVVAWVSFERVERPAKAAILLWWDLRQGERLPSPLPTQRVPVDVTSGAGSRSTSP